jgi:GT2 family glycosyltransferase
MTPGIDVIVPVYGGAEVLRRCLSSVLDCPQQVSYRLVIINDASPDPEIQKYLEAVAAEHEHVLLLENPQNLGFVGTVNRGMSLGTENDVVLLNSDTEVANDWLNRLVAAAYADERIGTVTPFSNNATICSFPCFCQSSDLPEHWSVAELDELFSQVNKGGMVDIPTGVGFCQYIRRDCLEQTGLFDEERFGRGYGEENDFCRRAAALGWRNVLCCDTFVFHEGGASFSHEQEERIARAQEILKGLHPDYHALVEKHVHEDPALIYRIRVLLEMLRRSPRKKVLHLTHHLGGGTKKHIRELSDWLSGDMDSLVIRPVEGRGIHLAFGHDDEAPKLFFDLPAMYPRLVQLLDSMGLSRIHFHHTLGLETCLWGLPDDLGLPFDVTLHDYYFINAHPSQTDARGRYTPDLQAQSSSYPLSVSLEEWQENQKRLLYRAQRVIAPSAWVVKEYRKYFPDARYRVAWHPDSEQNMPWPPSTNPAPGDRSLRVLVLGALSPEKGADVLESVAVEARRRGLPLEFHLLGYAYRPLDVAVVEHGAYAEADLPQRLEEIQPDIVWFTALWPETYSYTLSEVLLAGLPLVAPDLGAFPERLQGRPLSWIRPWASSAEDWLQWFGQAPELLSDMDDGPFFWQDQPWPEAGSGFYRRTYLSEGESVKETAAAPVDDAWLENLLQDSRHAEAGQGNRGFREQLLIHLLALRQGRVGRLVSRLVPVSVQRKLKRKLSRKPIHELRRD